MALWAKLTGVAAIAAMAVGVVPSSADAASASISGSTILISEPASRTPLSLSDDGEYTTLFSEVTDPSPSASSPCEVVSTERVRCPSAGITAIVVTLGSGDDYLGVGSNLVAPLTVNAGAGDDTVFAGFASLGATLNGEDGVDVLAGGLGNDVINGGPGNDGRRSHIPGFEFQQEDQFGLYGGDGADTINGGAGDDLLRNLRSTLEGTSSDVFNGDSGNDELSGGEDDRSPSDVLNGGEGYDSVTYPDRFVPTGPGSSHAIGVSMSLDGQANDGQPGENDSISGDVEVLAASSEGSTLVGNDGPNVLELGGSGEMRGGGGNDTLRAVTTRLCELILGGCANGPVFGTVSPVLADGGPGDDALFGGDPSQPRGAFGTFAGGEGNDRLTGAGLLEGGPGNDLLDGTEEANTLDGGPGDDQVSGRGGDDQIVAGPGSDLVDGGVGRDFYGYPRTETKPITIKLNGLPDDGHAGETANVFAVEIVETGSGGDTLIGSAAVESLQGGGGDDRIDGGPGDDELHGDVGDDSLDGGPGDDNVAGAQGADEVVGGGGDDHLSTDRNARSGDPYRCGPGDDRLSAGGGDRLSADCEWTAGVLSTSFDASRVFLSRGSVGLRLRCESFRKCKDVAFVRRALSSPPLGSRKFTLAPDSIRALRIRLAPLPRKRRVRGRICVGGKAPSDCAVVSVVRRR